MSEPKSSLRGSPSDGPAEPVSAPDTLYHYTTREGVVGIATSRRLWATSIRHLNDAAEFTYAHGVLEKALGEAARGRPPDVVATVKLLQKDLDITRMDSRFAMGGTDNLTFVASFSTWGDQLSQWRAYCRSGGYSLGFQRTVLEEVASMQGFELVQCTYDPQRHRAEACELAEEFVHRVETEIPESARKAVVPAARSTTPSIGAYFFPLHNEIVGRLAMLAPTWKHSSFEEESEWRLVSRKPQKADFRVGASAIVPYTSLLLDFPAVRSGDKLAWFSEIGISPGDDQELAAMGLIQLFDANEIAWPKVSGSSSPLRPNW